MEMPRLQALNKTFFSGFEVAATASLVERIQQDFLWATYVILAVFGAEPVGAFDSPHERFQQENRKPGAFGRAALLRLQFHHSTYDDLNAAGTSGVLPIPFGLLRSELK
jgi:hypothetical protein